MRNILFSVLILLQFTIFSQKNCNALLKAKLAEKELPAQLDVLVQGDIPYLIKNSASMGITVNYFAGDIASVRTSASSIAQLVQTKNIRYIEYIPSSPKLMNDTMVVKNRIKPVKQGMAPLTQAYDGTGVIVGVIDSGVDFNHPDFKDAMGNTRINFIWEQSPASNSTTPQPYNYGIEWTAAQINASLCTHSDLAQYGHGTHVTGTAAGNGLANGKHEGVAPKADIIVVAMNFNNYTNNIYADAINYIFTKANLAGKPCVINASVGNYYGSHDGTDLQAKLIDNMLTSQPGRVLVAAAGNAGNLKIHTKTTLTNTDTLFTWITNTGSNLYYYLYADTANIKNVQLSVGVNRPSSTDLGRIPFQNYNYAIASQKVDTLKFNNQRIGIIKTNASINSFGVYELFYYIKADSLNYKWRIESKGAGLHDAWNFDFVSTGLPTTTVYPNISKYVMPDTISTLVTSFQCSKEVITVGNYINLNKWYDVNNTLQTSTEIAGQIKETSSQGPTRTNIVKPDIVATGANLFSAMALGMQANLVANLPSAVAQGSMHVQGGGTSAASPVVAGLAALYLQAFPNANNQQVKQAIMNCAYSDGFTGVLPNNVYGSGKLDGMGAMLCSIFTGLEKVKLSDGLNVFPNPFQGKAMLQIPQSSHASIQVYDINGKCIFMDEFDGAEYTIDAAKFNQYKGILFVRIKSNEQVYTTKLISN